jgi:uncharacterized damage-inducible protein DinB
MTAIVQQDFTGNLLKLLSETFEGAAAHGGSAYLDKGAGLLQTVDTLAADAASQSPYPGAPTIAAHCAHVAYYIRVLHNFLVGREQTVDWPSSWQTSRVDDAQWEELRRDLGESYGDLLATLSSLEAWGDEEVGDSMAVVVHTAYHLGAIRQVLRALGAQSSGT